MKKLFFTLLQLCVLSLGILTLPAAAQEKFEWDNIPDKTYSYAAMGQALTQILEEWAEDMDIEIFTSNKLDRKVWIRFQEGSGKEFFFKIAKEENLSWLYYGSKLYVYPKREEKKKIIRLNHISPLDFKEQLEQLDIFRDKFLWKTSPSIFMTIGPPKYVELVTEVAGFLDNQDTLVMKTFPLKYSWVQDRIISTRGEKTLVPGLATILGRLLFSSEQDPESNNLSPTLKMIPPSLPNKASIKPAKGAFIQADTRRNALIIRDYSRNMSLYQAVIDTLDKPTALIEITMTILDTDVKDENNLGIKPPTSLGFELDLKNPAKPFIIKTTKIAFTLEMLQSTGDGSVISEPVIITMDNMEAVMDHSSTLYIKVLGEKDAKLVPITSGTMLRVTPNLVKKENGEEFIRLLLSIEDGSFGKTSEGVGGIPRVKRSVINTQAEVMLDESLVVGGYYKESLQEGVEGIPFLSQLPVIGKFFFGNTTRNYHTSRRLFIITPRIIENNHSSENVE